MTMDYENSLSFKDLKKNINKDFSSFPKIKIAILGDSSTQILVQSIRGYGFVANFDFELYESDYNQIDQQVFDESSSLNLFNPDYIFIFESSLHLFKKFCHLKSISDRINFSKIFIERVEAIYNHLSSKSKAKIIFSNFYEINDGVFGNFTNKVESSFCFQLRKINYDLQNLALKLNNLFISDLALLMSWHGLKNGCDFRHYYNADMVLSIDFYPLVAKNITEIISSLYGRLKKCVILDLDNTLWGGIIGDDGLENIQIGDLGMGKAFSNFQLWIKELEKRGLILAVCSKNSEHIAKEPFEKHPDMILRLSDISVFVANWNSKVDNIKYIQEILNIGFDSMVFLDDNPAEREIVRTYLPEVTVPELPTDPAEYLSYLWSLNLFETTSFSENDQNRTIQYQEEAARSIFYKSFSNEDEFLKSLEMSSLTNSFQSFDIPRIAQLTVRSNQFNLRTVRYTEEDIKKITVDCFETNEMQGGGFITRSFTLKDKFGENGLIGLLIMQMKSNDLFIDTWIMSCRVLKRGMEHFMLNEAVDVAKKAKAEFLVGEYLPTKKNGIIKDHYQKLGFWEKEGLWFLRTIDYQEKLNYIKRYSN